MFSRIKKGIDWSWQNKKKIGFVAFQVVGAVIGLVLFAHLQARTQLAEHNYRVLASEVNKLPACIFAAPIDQLFSDQDGYEIDSLAKERIGTDPTEVFDFIYWRGCFIADVAYGQQFVLLFFGRENGQWQLQHVYPY